MIRFSFIMIMACMVFLLGCETTEVVSPQIEMVSGEIGTYHNEYLDNVFQKLDSEIGRLTAGEKEEVLFQEANKIAEKYGVKPLTREEINNALALGRKYSMMDPDSLAKSILPVEQYEWWLEFASRATPMDASRVYLEVCQEKGRPEKGTLLEDMLNISIHSAQFWRVRHEHDEPEVYNPYARPILKGWKENLLRFTVVVATDAITGAIAGAGTGGNPVAAGVVGGLCSYAADDILFGD